MGWLGVMAIKPMLANLPEPGLWWLLAGGLSYTAGVVFYLWRQLPFHHAVWHLFVLGGSVSHFVAIYFYVY
jgi:hemolysin III